MGIWSGSAGPLSGTMETEWTANCGPRPSHHASSSLKGVGLVLGCPSRSIQLTSRYLTPFDSSSRRSSPTRRGSGIAASIEAG